MEYYVGYLKDSVGSNYLGVNIPEAIVEPFLDKLRNALGEDEFEIFTNNQKNRDNGHYHITVMSVRDYNILSKEMDMYNFVNSLELILGYPVDDIEMLGIGTATNKGNTTYFIVCNSDKLDAIRNRYNLPKQDFHITIGFNRKDVFGIPKNEVIIK